MPFYKLLRKANGF
jgi:hypothetical protein